MTANMYRFRVELSGWEGGPGLSTYFARFAALPVTEDVQGFADQLRAAYNTMAALMITGTSVNINPQVDVIRDTDGVLQTSSVITPPAVVFGLGSGTALSRATMIKSRFQTDQVVNGRNLRGGTYVGPITSSAIDDAGHIRATSIASVITAFNGLLDVAGGRLVVWHRPSGPGASDGDSGFVQTVSAMTKPAVLRSRRD